MLDFIKVLKMAHELQTDRHKVSRLQHALCFSNRQAAAIK